MNPHDRRRQNYTPEPEAAPPLWKQAIGLIVTAAAVYLFAVFCLSF